jgi:Nitroreductase family
MSVVLPGFFMNTDIDRRELIVTMGKSLFLLCASTLLQGCGGVSRESLLVEKKDEPGVFPNPDAQRILRLASLAPSGHNTQPWTVKLVEPQRWIIGSERTRWLPAVDPHNRELLLSIGAFLENLVVAANHYGYRMEYRLVATSPTDTDLLEVLLQKDTAISYQLENIRMRRTVRSGYLNRELRSEDLRQLIDGLSEWHYYPAGSAQERYLVEATIEANRKQASRDDAQMELANWIRWSNLEAERFRNGLTPESMEITGFAGWFVRTFYDREKVTTESFRLAGVDRVIEQVRQGAGWLAVVSPDSEMTHLIETGRMFERLFLRVRSRSVAMHPMTQVLEEQPWREQVATQLGIKGQVQFVLRVGYVSSYPDPVSLRMPVPRFIR